MNARRLGIAAIGAAGAMLNIWCACHFFEPGGAWKGRNDFLGFYAGSRLAGSPALYDFEAVRREQVRASGEFVYLQFARLPAYAVLLKPLAWMPYHAAYALWLAIGAAAFVAFAMLWPAESAAAKYAVCGWSLPAFVCLFNGQDVLLTLFWLALSVWLEGRRRPFAAGMAMALCASKFHLFLLAPVAVAARREWRMLAGGAAGGAGLLAVSFAAQGVTWPRSYLAALTDPRMNPNPAIMPNLHAMLGEGRAAEAIQMAATLVLAAMVWRIARRSKSLAVPVAIAVAASLVVSFHSFMADCAVLLPALSMAIAWPSKLAKVLAMTLIWPVPWFWLNLPPAMPVLTRTLLLVFLAGMIALGLSGRGEDERRGDGPPAERSAVSPG